MIKVRLAAGSTHSFVLGLAGSRVNSTFTLSTDQLSPCLRLVKKKAEGPTDEEHTIDFVR